MEHIPVLLVLLSVITGIILYFYPLARYFAVFLIQGILLWGVLYLYNRINLHGEFLYSIGGWMNGVGISLKVNNLSCSFMLLAVMLWTMFLIYIINMDRYLNKLLLFLFILQGTFLGFLFTNDIFTMYVLLEVTTALVCILILFNRTDRAVFAALYYLLINMVAMVFVLMGIALIYQTTGYLDMDLIRESISGMEDSRQIVLSYSFIMTGIFLKAAFFPVFSWLPKAHGNSISVVSALLSGIMVKAGIFAFIRFEQTFGLEFYRELLVIIGIITALTGAVFVLCQTDIKMLLAYSTVSHIGLILAGLMSNPLSSIGGLYHIYSHGILKALLFLGAGVIIENYKERDMRKLQGIGAEMPLISLLMIIGMLGITGSPFLNGGISKFIIIGYLNHSLTYQIMYYIVNLATTAAFIRMAGIFFGKHGEKRSVSTVYYIVCGILALASIVGGILFKPIIDFLWGEQADLSYNFIYHSTAYAAIVASGFFLNKWLRTESSITRNIRKMAIPFNGAALLLILLFSTLLIWAEFH